METSLFVGGFAWASQATTYHLVFFLLVALFSSSSERVLVVQDLWAIGTSGPAPPQQDRSPRARLRRARTVRILGGACAGHVRNALPGRATVRLCADLRLFASVLIGTSDCAFDRSGISMCVHACVHAAMLARLRACMVARERGPSVIYKGSWPWEHAWTQV